MKRKPGGGLNLKFIYFLPPKKSKFTVIRQMFWLVASGLPRAFPEQPLQWHRAGDFKDYSQQRAGCTGFSPDFPFKLKAPYLYKFSKEL